MSSDLMRWVDRWFGPPICFVLSVLLAVAGKLAPARPPAGVERICFICLAEIGALALAHSALQLARRRHPGCRIYFLTFAAGRDMLELIGVPPDQIICLQPRSSWTLLTSTVQALVRLRRERLDATVNLEVFARFSTILAALSGAPKRAGFFPFREQGQYVGDLVTHRVVYSPHHHIARAYMSLVAALGEAGGTEPAAKIHPDALPMEVFQVGRLEAAEASLDTRLASLAPYYDAARHRLIVLNANASDLVPARRWPRDNYVELARRLLNDERNVIVLSGSRGEREAVSRLAEEIGGPRLINLAGLTSMRELIALFARADLLVTNDSGPAHFASVTDVPTLALFGPETPRIFGPIGPRQQAVYRGLACSPCVSVYNQKRSPCTDNLCMKGITVDALAAAAVAILQQSDRPAGASGRPALLS